MSQGRFLFRLCPGHRPAPKCLRLSVFFFLPELSLASQEDVNSEKLTVKKWWILGADFFTVYTEFSRLKRDIHGEQKKHLVIDDLFHG